MEELASQEVAFCATGKFDHAVVHYCQRTGTSVTTAKDAILQHLRSKGNKAMKHKSIAYAPKNWAGFLLNDDISDFLTKDELAKASDWAREKAAMGLYAVDIIPDDADENNYAYLMGRVPNVV